MNILIRTFFLSVAVCLAACSQPAQTRLEGNWAIKSDESRVTFVTIKAGEIVEAHSFDAITGAVTADGAAEVRIVLDSVETNIDIRNERMREFLFETDVFPTAAVTTRLDPSVFAGLDVGETIVQPVTAVLALHGAESELEADLAITRTGPDKVLVTTNTPVILHVDSFGLGNGLEKLRELASLPGITPEVPVMVSLVFTRQGKLQTP